MDIEQYITRVKRENERKTDTQTKDNGEASH